MTSSGVGTLRETHLHAALKEWCAQPGDEFEVPVGNFIADIWRDGRIVEIQTRGFSSLKRKLDSLLDDYPIRIVHPIPAAKWIVRGPHGGKSSTRRKSPKSGSVHDIFGELVSFPWLVDHPNLTLEIVMTQEEEVRHFDGNRSWRRKGWAVVDRRLLDVTESCLVSSPHDLEAMLPAELPEEFTTADLAGAIGRPRRTAQQMAYCLREMGRIEIVGKDGNALRYGRAQRHGVTGH